MQIIGHPQHRRIASRVRRQRQQQRAQTRGARLAGHLRGDDGVRQMQRQHIVQQRQPRLQALVAADQALRLGARKRGIEHAVAAQQLREKVTPRKIHRGNFERDARAPQHADVTRAGLGRGVCDQARFADAGLAAQYHATAGAVRAAGQ